MISISPIVDSFRLLSFPLDYEEVTNRDEWIGHLHSVNAVLTQYVYVHLYIVTTWHITIARRTESWNYLIPKHFACNN